jgi:hypothetical protein
MSTFAVADLKKVNMGAAIVEYLERIDETGAVWRAVPGSWRHPGTEFPDHEGARDWYGSPTLRTKNSGGGVILIDTVPGDHRATDILNRPTEE